MALQMGIQLQKSLGIELRRSSQMRQLRVVLGFFLKSIEYHF